MDGIILIDKPKNFTSFDVVNLMKKRFKLKKIGHCGTLDPLATGLLIILIGKATKLADTFLNDSKKYFATMLLGVKTDTLDVTGKIIEIKQGIPVSQKVVAALKSFEGEIEQRPPLFSALKYKGQTMYKLARGGKIIIPEKRKVVIHHIRKIKWLPPLASKSSLSLLFEGNNIFSGGRNMFKHCYDNADALRDLPEFFFEVKCSKGTYIRSLCDNAGELLGCGAALKELRRVESGKFKIKDAVSIDKLKEADGEESLEKFLFNI